jgi:ferritin-like metal-binding protein YciE
MQMETLQDLYVDVLKDLYDAENRILQALPNRLLKNSSFRKRAFSSVVF